MESRTTPDHANAGGGAGGGGPGLKDILLTLAIVGGGTGIGLLILSRFVAQTRGASIYLAVAWIAVAATVVGVFAARNPRLRSVALGGLAVTVAGIVAVGYWTGFRETRVDETVAVASGEATGAERNAALSGIEIPATSVEEKGREKPKPKPAGPVSVAEGGFTGVDGHDGTGQAEIVAEGAQRALTFTKFDVDPGPQVDVYLTTGPDTIDDRIELGGLKGSAGNQQYEVPKGVNLKRYDTVVLWCIPFTTRIAVAELR